MSTREDKVDNEWDSLLREIERERRAKKKGREQIVDKIISGKAEKREETLFERFEREMNNNPPKTQVELRRFFRKHALALHPDKGGDEAKFIAMKDAVKEYALNHPILSVPNTLQGGKRRRRTRRHKRRKKTRKRKHRRTRKPRK